MNRLATPTQWVIAAILTVVAGYLIVTRLTGDYTAYEAEFAHASGISAGDEVRVAGIPVGHVTGIELDGAHAIVAFRVESDIVVHHDGRAAVKMATLLGQNYLELDPGSRNALGNGERLAADRTNGMYTLAALLTDAQRDLNQLDLDLVESALDTLAVDLDLDASQADDALNNVTELANLLGDHDDQIGELLTQLRHVTTLVRSQTDEIESLMDNGEVVANLILQHRTTIERLLTHAHLVVTELDNLANRAEDDVTVLLAQYNTVLDAMTDHLDELDLTIARLAPMSRYFANATGNGPWIDVFAPYFLLPDNLVCLLQLENCS